MGGLIAATFLVLETLGIIVIAKDSDVPLLLIFLEFTIIYFTVNGELGISLRSFAKLRIFPRITLLTSISKIVAVTPSGSDLCECSNGGKSENTLGFASSSCDCARNPEYQPGGLPANATGAHRSPLDIGEVIEHDHQGNTDPDHQCLPCGFICTLIALHARYQI